MIRQSEGRGCRIPCPLTDCCIGWLWDLAEEYMGFKGIAVCCTVRFDESEILETCFFLDEWDI